MAAEGGVAGRHREATTPADTAGRTRCNEQLARPRRRDLHPRKQFLNELAVPLDGLVETPKAHRLAEVQLWVIHGFLDRPPQGRHALRRRGLKAAEVAVTRRA